MSRKSLPVVVLFAVLLCGAWPVMASEADAQLVIPEDFDVIAVDGEKHARKLFAPGDTRLVLPAGEHHLVLKYDRIFEQNEAIEKVKSAPFELSAVLAPDGKYRLEYDAPATAEEARDYVKAVQVRLVSDSQEPVVMTLSQPQSTTPKTHGKKTGPKPSEDQPSGGSEVTGQLHYWWGRASDQERQAFLKAVVKP